VTGDTQASEPLARLGRTPVGGQHLMIARGEVPPPGGEAARLNGKPMGLRCAWRDPSRLLAGRPLCDRDFLLTANSKH
jgi:hypothetical protein